MGQPYPRAALVRCLVAGSAPATAPGAVVRAAAAAGPARRPKTAAFTLLTVPDAHFVLKNGVTVLILIPGSLDSLLGSQECDRDLARGAFGAAAATAARKRLRDRGFDECPVCRTHLDVRSGAEGDHERRTCERCSG